MTLEFKDFTQMTSQEIQTYTGPVWFASIIVLMRGARQWIPVDFESPTIELLAKNIADYLISNEVISQSIDMVMYTPCQNRPKDFVSHEEIYRLKSLIMSHGVQYIPFTKTIGVK